MAAGNELPDAFRKTRGEGSRLLAAFSGGA
jgi:hypothetical protein